MATVYHAVQYCMCYDINTCTSSNYFCNPITPKYHSLTMVLLVSYAVLSVHLMVESRCNKMLSFSSCSDGRVSSLRREATALNQSLLRKHVRPARNNSEVTYRELLITGV